MFRLPSLPTEKDIQARIDAALAGAPQTVRDRLEWVRYVDDGAAWPEGTSQTLVLTDVSSGEDLRLAIKSKGFGTEALIEFALGRL